MSKITTLFTLPRELRDQIYAYALYPPFPWSYDIPYSYDFPGICQTNRQLYYETLPVYISFSMIQFYNTAKTLEIQDWLSELQVTGQFGNIYAVVRSVKIWMLEEKNADREMQFLQRCTSLRELNIHLYIEVPSGDIGEDEDRVMAKDRALKTVTLQEVLATHRLAAILDCTRLEKLELILPKIPGHNSLPQSVKERQAFMGILKDWFVEQWALMGKRNVEVRWDVQEDDSDGDEVCFAPFD
jgi:hypothetical protein